ncbi:hypothetical protein SFRURICE_006017 [Spodoptera frugiperda]|nr:hypothetical protein SFRURICE_006017 [Spodoptera frugiperda]
MDAENEYEIKKVRDAIQTIETIQSMIDVSAERLEGLRTQCSTSAELTQQEIRTLEGKLVKHFSRQLVIKASFGEELRRKLGDVPRLAQWLRVVGLSPDSITAVCSRVASLETLRERSDHEMRALLAGARDEEVLRLCRAMQRLRTYIGGKSPPTPVAKRKQPSTLPPPAALTKSRSHESQLSVRPDASDLSDNSQSSAVGTSEVTPPASPHDTESEHTPLHRPLPYHNNNVRSPAKGALGRRLATIMACACAPERPRAPPPAPSAPPSAPRTPHHDPTGVGVAPRSPRTPTVSRCMAHDIAHRFTKTMLIATCDYCDKQMFGSALKCKECKFKCHRYTMLIATCDYCDKQMFGSALKCKECKFKCHRDCESKVPPSCGLPPEFVDVFKEKFHKDVMSVDAAGGYYYMSGRGAGILSSLTHRRRPHAPPASHHAGGPDSSSNTSSCNSSTPSSPALAPPLTPHHLHHHPHHPTTPTTRTIRTIRPPLNNSSISQLSMKEWDIPYDELKLFEVIGTGRFGTVYRGSWHGAVAVKLLHVLSDDCVPLDTFKHEVATFRKTRHENLVLFMGACMKPPRLAIVTSLCKGMTLYTHIHLRKDKFTANKSVLVAQQISQGMGYLHARGIIHKDLKTKNIFLENGKVVITDFGLFSVTKLCFGNNLRGDSLGIPAGWLCYLAPELCRALTPHASLHLPFSKATDVYAFGTVWYELLCGEYPFKSQPPEAVIWQVGKGVKQSLANMQASRDIKDILMLCWSYRSSERPDFPHLLTTLQKLPRKRLARSPSHPVHLSRSADSVF